MAIISDDDIKEIHTKFKDYTIVLIKSTPKRVETGVGSIIWEHGRRNLSLREDGVLPIVCPVFGNENLSGLYIFNANADEARKIMDGDPAVKAGIFRYEVYPCKGIPGDSLTSVKYCQSCGMPFDETHRELIAENADGSDSIYCSYCYKDGKFLNPGATVQDMVEMGVPHLAHKIGEAAARKQLSLFVPTLARWS